MYDLSITLRQIKVSFLLVYRRPVDKHKNKNPLNFARRRRIFFRVHTAYTVEKHKILARRRRNFFRVHIAYTLKKYAILPAAGEKFWGILEGINGKCIYFFKL